MQTTFTKSKFEIDDTPQFEGYTAGHSWNGWDCPYFTKEVANQIAEFMENDNNMHFYYQENFDRYIILFTHDTVVEEPEVYEGTTITVDGEEIKVYPLGNGSWCWTDVRRYE